MKTIAAKNLQGKIVNNGIFGFGTIVKHNEKTGLISVKWDNEKHNKLAFQLTFIECVTIHASYASCANAIVKKMVNAGMSVDDAIQRFKKLGTMLRPKAWHKTESAALSRIRKQYKQP